MAKRKVKITKTSNTPHPLLRKYATATNALLLTLVAVLVVLGYNMMTGTGFFAGNPASINKVAVEPTRTVLKSRPTTGVQSTANLGSNQQSGGGGTITGYSNGGGIDPKKDPRKNKEDDGPVKNILKTIVSTAAHVVYNAAQGDPVGVAMSLGIGSAQLATNPAVQQGAATVVTGISGGTNTQNKNIKNVKDEDGSLHSGSCMDKCMRKGGATPNDCKMECTGTTTYTPPGMQDVINQDKNKNKDKDEYCGGGKSPMKVGKSYPTGAAYTDEKGQVHKDQRACVEILPGCNKHGPAKPCHTLPENLVVLPSGAGAEYTNGEATKSDGSNIKKDKKRNCIDNGGAPVPHNDTQVDKDGKTQFCNNGIWDYTAASGNPQEELQKQKDLCAKLNKIRNSDVFNYAVVDGKCVSSTNKCKPGCGSNGERYKCTPSGGWEVGSCSGTQVCVGSGQCEELPGTTVSNGKKIVTLTKAACVASWIVSLPPGVGPAVTAACAALNAGTKTEEKIEIPETAPQSNPSSQSSSQGNTILSDAPGVVNLDTAGTVAGCAGGLVISFIPCTGVAIVGSVVATPVVGIPASMVCRTVACGIGGTAGNKTGDAIYNFTH